MITTLLACLVAGLFALVGLACYYLPRFDKSLNRLAALSKEQYAAQVDIARSARRSIPLNRL